MPEAKGKTCFKKERIIKTADGPHKMITGFSNMSVDSDLDTSGFCRTMGRNWRQ